MSETPQSVATTSTASSVVSVDGDEWVSLDDAFEFMDNVWAVSDDEDSTFEKIDMKTEELVIDSFNETDKKNNNNDSKNSNNNNNNTGCVTSNGLLLNDKNCDENAQKTIHKMALLFDTKLENEVNNVKKYWKLERKIRVSMYNKLFKENKLVKEKLSKLANKIAKNNEKIQLQTTEKKTNELQHSDCKETSTETENNTNNKNNHINDTYSNEMIEQETVQSVESSQTQQQPSSQVANIGGECCVNTESHIAASSLNAAENANNANTSSAVVRDSSKNNNNNNNRQQQQQSESVVSKFFSVFRQKSINQITKNNKFSKTGERKGEFNILQELSSMETTIGEIFKECKKTNKRLNDTELLECQSSMDKIESLLNVVNGEISTIRSNVTSVSTAASSNNKPQMSEENSHKATLQTRLQMRDGV